MARAEGEELCGPARTSFVIALSGPEAALTCMDRIFRPQVWPGPGNDSFPADPYP